MRLETRRLPRLDLPHLLALPIGVLILLIYIIVPWTTPGTPVGQDFVRRTHDYKTIHVGSKNEFAKTKFYKMPLKTSGLNFRPTPLLGCRGCSRGRECGQVALGVVSVRGVEFLGPGVLCLRARCPLLRPG